MVQAMNKSFVRGYEIDGKKMKMGECQPDRSSKASWLGKSMVSLMGVLSICAPAQVAAEVCEAELEQAVSLTHPSRYGQKRAGYEKLHKESLTYVSRCQNAQSNVTGYERDINEISKRLNGNRRDTWGEQKLAELKFYLCTQRVALSRCGSQLQQAPTILPPQNLAPAESSANASPEANRLNTEINEATARAQKHQDEVDRARKGKPKRHVLGAEAHNCLKLQLGGGVINDCPYAVEYNYCVYRPKKDSWSEAFDCEKGKGGSWQIGAGPNSRSIMHTAGEMTYWFACKYGPTLHDPDGISPADIEFQRGRGLLGRCAEWGSGGKS